MQAANWLFVASEYIQTHIRYKYQHDVKNEI
jgi:hypothetical protein